MYWKHCEVKQRPARLVLVVGWVSGWIRENYIRYVTFGGSGGIKAIAGLELPYLQVISQTKIRDESSRRGNEYNSEGM